jgi:hypothetical protein
MYMLLLPAILVLVKANSDISYAALGLLVTTFHASTGAMEVPAGFQVDRFGARIALVVGMRSCAICMGAIGAVDADCVMAGLTTLAGIRDSVFRAADSAILAASVDDNPLGQAFGFHLPAGNLGFAAAPVLLIVRATRWNWRSEHRARGQSANRQHGADHLADHLAVGGLRRYRLRAVGSRAGAQQRRLAPRDDTTSAPLPGSVRSASIRLLGAPRRHTSDHRSRIRRSSPRTIPGAVVYHRAHPPEVACGDSR